MENRKENKISMYRKVGTFLEEQKNQFLLYPAIATLKTKIDNNFLAIIDFEVVAGADNTGQTVAKNELQQKLINQILKVGNAAVLYYTITEPNLSQKEKVYFTKKKLVLMNNAEQYAAGQKVWAIAEEIKNLLSPFGVSAAEVDKLQTILQQFFNIYQKPKQKKGEAIKAGKGVDKLISETDKILESELDVLMGIVKIDNPDLYAMYVGARKIDDTGSRGSNP